MANLRNVTHPVLGYNGVERWTANNGLSLNLKVRDEFVVKRPNFKIRITFIPDQGEILFTPIVQLAIHKSVEFDDIEFNDENSIATGEV